MLVIWTLAFGFGASVMLIYVTAGLASCALVLLISILASAAAVTA